MKQKMTLILLILFLCFICIQGKSKKDKTLSGFMGVKWGENSQAFLSKIQSKKAPEKFGDNNYKLTAYHMKGATFVDIYFYFLKENESGNFIFNSAQIKFNHYSFWTVHKFLKKQYGKAAEHKYKYLRFKGVMYGREWGSGWGGYIRRVLWENQDSRRKVEILVPESVARKLFVQNMAINNVSKSEVKFGRVFLSPIHPEKPERD